MVKKIVTKVSQLPREERPQHVVLWVIRGIMLLVALAALSFGDWENFFIGLLALALSFIPELIETTYKVVLPIEFEAVIVLFIFLSVFLGETVDIYERIWWWDGMLHIASGLVLSFAAYLFLYNLYRQKKLVASPVLIALLVFMVGLTLGVIWEIFEFTMDNLFGLNMQRSGLQDTMGDLIVDAMGSGIVAMISYEHIVFGRKENIVGKLTRRFFSLNPNIERGKHDKNR
jgi:hypothetical protein